MKTEISNNIKWHESLTVKLAILLFLGILSLVPLAMIKLVILERQKNFETVKAEIFNQWALRQFVTGPVLNIPVKTIPRNKDEKGIKSTWHLLPDKLEIFGEITPEIRTRSIYKAVVYDSRIEIKGDFLIPDPHSLPDHEILWKDAYYTLGISDNRGIKGRVKMETGSYIYDAVPGVKDTDIFKSGITFDPVITDTIGKHSFRIILCLSGSESLFFNPVGKTTKTVLNSSWNSPGFAGHFLPAERTILNSGFHAEWLVTDLNRNFPQSWTGNLFNTDEYSFGVNLLMAADHYQKSFRCAKYGLLFIALTFMVLIFIELTLKEKIHIFNYFLLSLGLVLFFSLLTALSEHLGFSYAYLIASLATILLLTFFIRSLFSRGSIVLLIFGLLVFLYLFIYVILSLNDFALMAGNIGLFILLAIIMRFSGRINLFKKDIHESGQI